MEPYPTRVAHIHPQNDERPYSTNEKHLRREEYPWSRFRSFRNVSDVADSPSDLRGTLRTGERFCNDSMAASLGAGQPILDPREQPRRPAAVVNDSVEARPEVPEPSQWGVMSLAGWICAARFVEILRTADRFNVSARRIAREAPSAVLGSPQSRFSLFSSLFCG
jgi:hypothetical protein